MKTTTIGLGAILLTSLSAQAAITILHEYKLGEVGSLVGTNNLPQDSIGGQHFTIDNVGAAATIGTSGVSAPGSTAYLSTGSSDNTGWFGTDYSTVPVNNFGFGLWVRAAALVGNTSNIFAMSGNTGGFSLALSDNGWAASANGVAWIGEVSGVTGSFVANEWTHLALVRQDGDATFYIDGVAQNAIPFTGDPVNDSALLSVSPGGGSYFDGDLDEARIVSFISTDSTSDILNAISGVPEPSSAALLGLGGLALILRRRK